MARNISLTKDEIEDLEKTLHERKGELPDDEARFLRFLLDKANSEKVPAADQGPGWLFTWTYRF